MNIPVYLFPANNSTPSTPINGPLLAQAGGLSASGDQMHNR